MLGYRDTRLGNIVELGGGALHLKSVRVTNYKSIHQVVELQLQPGINLFLGPNGSGKTSVLRAISLKLDKQPHRSSTTHPKPGSVHLERSDVTVDLQLDWQEVIDVLEPVEFWCMPAPKAYRAPEFQTAVDDWFRSFEEVNLSVGADARGPDLLTKTLVAFGEPVVDQAYISRRRDDQGGWTQNSEERHARHSIVRLLWEAAQARMFFVSAERPIQHEWDATGVVQLAEDMRNLPPVIEDMRSDSARFAEFNELVRRVLPQVHEVNTRNEGGIDQVVVYFEPVQRGRQDLGVPLMHCGTGIAQVVGLVARIVTSDEPSVFLIDEPQSYLHPGAFKRLMRVFEAHRQHQYVIATHAPAALSCATVSTAHIFELVEQQTRVTPINPASLLDLRTAIAAVGASPADLYGADVALWVEGPTEVAVVPDLINHFGSSDPNRFPAFRRAIEVFALANTSDFDKRPSKPAVTRVLALYTNMGTSAALLLPPSLAIVLDREQRKPEHIAEYEKRQDARVRFLEEQMLESYLLRPEAVAAVLSGALDRQVEPQEVDPHLRSDHAPDRRLKAVFQEVSNNTHEFRKTTHSVELVRWLLKHHPEDLKPVAQVIHDAVNVPAE